MAKRSKKTKTAQLLPGRFDHLSRKEREVMAAAYHEAGHAVFARLYGATPEDIEGRSLEIYQEMIYPNKFSKKYNGVCYHTPFVKKGEGGQLNLSHRRDNRVDDLYRRITIDMRVRLAGPLAEKKSMGSSQRFPAGKGDIKAIWELITEVCNLYYDIKDKCYRVYDPDEIEEWITEDATEVRYFLNMSRIWNAVQNLAEALRKKFVIKADEAIELMDEHLHTFRLKKLYYD